MAESTQKPPKNKGGRPRKVVQMPVLEPEKPLETDPDAPPPDETPAETSGKAEKVSLKPFPTPPKPGKHGFCTEQEGMDYWRNLPAELADRVSIYINREYPILDRLQELSEEQRAEVRRGKRGPTKYIDKPLEPFGPDTRMEFLHRYGSGTYKVYVNDTGVTKYRKDPDHPELHNRNVCKFLVSYHDSDFPPILDPTRPDKGIGILDLNHPQNGSYIGELRMKGVLPPLPQQGEDMAGNEVVQKLTDKIESLADQVAEGKTDRLLATVREELKKGNGNGESKLMELMFAFMLRPQPAPADNSTALVGIFQTQMSQLNEALRDERAERRKLEEHIRTQATQPPPDPFAYFERMTTTMEKAKQIFGGGTAGGVAAVVGKHASRMNGTLEFFSELLPKLAEAPILNALAYRLMQGAPAAAGTIGGAATAANPAPSTDELLTFVQTVVTPAMFNYLEDDEVDGEDFATWLHAGFPDRFKALQEHGPVVIINTYKGSGAWKRIAPREQRFIAFVNQFCAWKPEPKDGADIDITPERPNGAPRPVINFDEPLEGNDIGGAANA